MDRHRRTHRSSDQFQVSSGFRAGALEAFSLALDRETHNLVRRPDLIWQQLYNRLQWQEDLDEQILAGHLAHRTAVGGRPWLRITKASISRPGSDEATPARPAEATPFAEGSALVRTIDLEMAWPNACAVSPDGGTVAVATATPSYLVTLWDAQTGLPKHRLHGHTAAPNDLAFHPTGGLLVSAGRDGLRYWDVQNGRETAFFSMPNRAGRCALTPDGSSIALAGERGVGMWQVATGEPATALEDSGHGAYCCAVSPDGKLVAGGLENGSVCVWVVETGELRATLDDHASSVTSCAFSPDGSLLVSGSKDGMAKIWSVGEHRVLHSISAHPNSGGLWAASVSPCGRWLSTAALSDADVALWDLTSGDPVGILEGHGLGVSACTFSEDGSILVSSSYDGTVKIWAPDLALRSPRRREIERAPSGAVFDCAFTRDGKSIVWTSADGAVWLSTGSAETRRIHECRGEPIRSCAVTPTGAVVFGGEEGILRVWDPETGCERTPAEAEPTITHHSSGGEEFVTIAPPPGSRSTVAEHSRAIHACAVSPDGSFAVSASEDHTLKLWDLDSVEPVMTLEGHGSPNTSCAVSPDGATIVSGAWDKHIRLWDAETGHNRAALGVHVQYVEACAISPDGSVAVSADRGGEVRVWDLSRGAEIGELAGHALPVSGCAVSPDGRLVATVSDDRSVRIWGIQTGREVAVLLLPSPAACVAFHPWRPEVACGDVAGALMRAELVGIEYASIVVTPVDLGGGYSIYCPFCDTTVPFHEDWLGREMACPRDVCGGPWKVNPFEAKRPIWAE